MRVALVTPEFPLDGQPPSGGLGHHVRRLALALHAAGHEAEVFVPVRGAAAAPAWVHPVDRAWPAAARWASRLVRHALPLPIDMDVRAQRLAGALLARHREAPFDVAQYAHLAAVGLRAPPAIPMLVRLSSWQPLWTAAGDGTTRDLQARIALRLELAALRRAQVVFAPSRRIAGAVGRVARRGVEVLEGPFRLDGGPAPGSAGIPGRYLLSIGHINGVKGVGIIARAAPRILAADPGLRWVLAGQETVAGTVAALRRAAGVGERILHLPYLGHPELYRLVLGAEAVVMPSLVDNLPNACLEAMALGACVVGTRPTGMEQVIEDGASGFLVPAGDAGALVAAVQRALRLPAAERRRIGDAAAAAVRRLDPATVLPRLLALYRRAQALHAAGRRLG